MSGVKRSRTHESSAFSVSSEAEVPVVETRPEPLAALEPEFIAGDKKMQMTEFLAPTTDPPGVESLRDLELWY